MPSQPTQDALQARHDMLRAAMLAAAGGRIMGQSVRAEDAPKTAVKIEAILRMAPKLPSLRDALWILLPFISRICSTRMSHRRDEKVLKLLLISLLRHAHRQSQKGSLSTKC